jgi:excisionase family DNA binding protein
VMATPSPGGRFLTLADVAEVLNTSSAQVYALVRGGDLPAIKIGGRGQWRVESSELEKYIQRMYEQTRDFVSTHRFGRPEDEDADGDREADGDLDGEPLRPGEEH